MYVAGDSQNSLTRLRPGVQQGVGNAPLPLGDGFTLRHVTELLAPAIIGMLRFRRRRRITGGGRRTPFFDRRQACVDVEPLPTAIPLES